ncbi:putative alpha-1,3-mannosyltransferase MNN1 [Candida tropicalis]
MFRMCFTGRNIFAIRKYPLLMIVIFGPLWILCLLFIITYNFSRINELYIDNPNYSIYNIYDNYKYSNQEVSNAKENSIKKNQEYFKNSTTFLSMVDYMFPNATAENDFNSDIYNKIFHHHDMDTILGTLSFKQRCDLYFKNVFIDNMNWAFNPERSYEIKAEGNDFEKYVKENKAMLEEKFVPDEKIFDKTTINTQFIDFTKSEYINHKTLKHEKYMANHLSIFRIFNKCYVSNNEISQIERLKSFLTEQYKLIHNLKSNIPNFSPTEQENLVNSLTYSPASFESRVYPWISKEYPVYERYTGKIFDQPPNYYFLLGDPVQKTTKNIKNPKVTSNDPFVKQFKNMCNGRGIVLTIGEQHVESTVNLIHLLRALQNHLPIQIVYYDDISDDSKRKIVTAAQEEFSDLPESFRKVSYMFGDDYLDNNGKGLVPQEVWFVNAYNAIQKHYRGKFSRFGNKLLAAFFNSFDEFMLIDADTVMMKSPEYFFNLKGYLKTGTFFFRDRAVHKRGIGDGELIERMAPNMIDSIMFDMPLITNYTRNNDYFRGVQHYMESGLLLIDKNRHYNSLLTIIEVNLIQRLRKLSYGDKELIWMGFAINGDENYIFNGNAAGAIGELTAPDDRLRPDGTRHHSEEICANHPGHVSSEDNHSLLWINSGFRFCHQSDEVDFKEEAETQTRLKFLKTSEAFKTFYYAPLRITHAIVPPLSPDLEIRRNKEDEPTSGWLWERDYCKRYMWCAYSSIGGKVRDMTKEDNILEGLFVQFTEEETNWFNYLGDIWIGTE